MIKTITSRFMKAFIGLMLLSAVLHLIVLAVYFLKTKDSIPLNFFSIIGANLFFPALVTSPFAPLYSFITSIVLYIVIFLFFTHENSRSR